MIPFLSFNEVSKIKFANILSIKETVLDVNVNNVNRYEEVIPVIEEEEYETIPQRQKRYILAIAYRQVCVFKRQ